MEDVEYPDDIVEYGERQLFIYWYESELPLQDLDDRLTHCGGTIEKALRYLGDPYAEGNFDAMYYKRDGDDLILIDSEIQMLKMPEDLSDNQTYPREMLVLLQKF